MVGFILKAFGTKSMASERNLFKVGKLAYSLYAMQCLDESVKMEIS